MSRKTDIAFYSIIMQSQQLPIPAIVNYRNLSSHSNGLSAGVQRNIKGEHL
jgi:hypothetical protein